MVHVGMYTNGIGYSYEDMKRLWMHAENLGFQSGWTMDNAVAAYAGYPDFPVFEPYTILPALAEATSTIRIGPLVTPVGRRHPALLAKVTSVLDVLSNGRLSLGMGIGDLPQLFVPWGTPFSSRVPERVDRLNEEIEVLFRLWAEPVSNFEGEYYHLKDAINEPKPIQKPRPPLWIGIQKGRRLLPKTAAKYADGFNTFIGPDDEARDLLSSVKEACGVAGRSFSEFERCRHFLITVSDRVIDVEGTMRRQAESQGYPSGFIEDHINTGKEYYKHIVGSPERIAEELEEQVKMGFDHLLLEFRAQDSPLGGSIDLVLEDMSSFAKGAISGLKGLDRR